MGRPTKRTGTSSDGVPAGTIGDAERFSGNATQSTADLSKLFDSLSALVASISPDHTIRYINKAYAERFGLSKQDLFGKHIKHVLGDDVYQSVLPQITRVLSGVAVSFERPVQYPDGAERFMRVSYTPDFDHHGKVQGFFAFVVDATDQHKVEQALIDSEERYRAFIGQSSEGIWRFELERPLPISLPVEEQVEWAYKYGYLAECNDAMARQYGFESASDLVGARLGDLLIRDDPNNTEFLKAFIRSDYRLGDAASHERDADGNDRYFLNNFVGIVENGRLIRAWGLQRDITEARVEEQARDRLAAIVESSDDAIISYDLDKNITSWNAAAEHIYGYSASETLGNPMSIVIPDDRREEEAEILERIKSGRNVDHFETQRRRKDGRVIDVSLTISPIRNRAGTIVGVSKITRDISERKASERALHENRLMLAMAMQSSRMGVWERDLATETVAWSEELEAIFGLRPGEFRGDEEHFYSLIHEDDRESTWAEVERSIIEKKPYNTEFRFYHSDGSVRWMEGRGEAVYSASGEPIRMYGIGLDITERKRTEEMLREGDERFRLALSSGAVTVYEQDRDLKYLWLYPISPDSEAAIGKTDIDIDPGPNGRRLHELKQNVIATGDSLREEIRSSLTGEERWYDLFVEPHRDSQGNIVGVGGAALDVTVRRRVREELRQSEERLQAMFDSTTVGFGVLDTSARFLQVNDAFCAITGFDRSELLEMTCTDLTCPDDLGEMEQSIAKLISGETSSFSLEKRFVRKDGNSVWVRNNVSLTHDADGRPLHLIVISQDVTAPKQAEDALRESEQRFSRFMQHLPGLAWIKDIEGHYVYANEAAQTSFGRSDKELYGKTDDEVFSPISAEQFKDHDRRAVESGTGIQVVESLLEPDGILHHAIVSKFPIAGTDGRTSMIGGMAIDITDQKQAEEDLRRRMEFDEAVMSNMGEGLYTVDSNACVTSMNPAAEKLLGWTFDEIRGHPIHELIHYKYRDGRPFPADECDNLRVLRDGKVVVNQEDAFIRKDGTFFNVLYSSSPILSDGKITGLVVVFQDISERKQAEEALERYRHLSEYANDIIWLLKEDGTVVDVNQAAVNAYGYSREELLRMNVRDLRHPSTIAELDGQIEAAREGNLHFETLHRRKDGTPIPVEVNASSAEFGGERLIMSIMRDITDRRRQEQTRDLLLRLSDLIRSEPDPSKVLKRSTKLLGEHLGAARCFFSAVDLDERTSTVLAEFYTDALEPLVKKTSYGDLSSEQLSSIQAGRTIVVPNATVGPKTRNNQLIHSSVSIRSYVAVPLQRNSRLAGVLCVSQDQPREWRESEISIVQTVAERVWLAVEKLRSEAALRESERRAIEEYQRLLERIVPLAETLGAARDLVSIYRSLQEFICASMFCSGFFVSFYDPESKLRLPAYIWGDEGEVNAADLPPMPITEGGGPNSRAILSKQTVITNKYWDEQQKRPHVVLQRDGRDPMSSLVVPMVVQDRVIGTLEVQAYQDKAFDREHAIALEMAANLAAVAIENVRLINTEAKARTEAETANRMKDEFLSVLSHELRTPLNAMLGWVRILRSGNVDEERMTKALEVIERNTRQQSSLIEDLLDVSRIISGKMRIENELIDLNPSLEQAAESVRSIAAAKGVKFDVKTSREPLYVTGDAVRLQQVITNLLQNAIKFTSSDGHVTLDRRRDGPNAIIEVTDTGIGIDNDFLPMIFDRFSQADASTKRHNTGLGLGLTIVRTIVEMHGGSTLAYSDGPGKGARFTVKLPLAEELYRPEHSTPALPVTNGQSESLIGTNILVVDDDEDSLLPLKIFLEKEKAIVSCAASASEALDQLRTRDFDVLISDIGMPAMDGFELIDELRKGSPGRNRSIKAIAYTAYASEEDRNRILSAGYQAHLSKPLEMDKLMALVRSLVRQRD